MAGDDGFRLPVRPLTPVQRRLLEPLDQDDQALSFQHVVLCHVGLPYRDPGDGVREWKRSQGAASLLVEAGQARHPLRDEWGKVGLPWGSKPRLILAHLNAEALRQGSPKIEVETSLTAFVRRIRGFRHGRETRAFKEQLTRLSNATVRLALNHGHDAFQINTQIIGAFHLWPEKDERQRVLWPSTIRLSLDYFASLQKNAVPLNEADLGALAHSALALDVYAWLAHRLHRIDPHKPAFISWAALKDQFGPDYGRMRAFKTFFRATLRAVLTRYQEARVELDERGMTARCSPPPVRARFGFIRGAKVLPPP
jgi:hypothetical protein